MVRLCRALALIMTLALSPALAQSPDVDEATLFQKAQSSGLPADYQAYLDEYPAGVFAEIALFELEWATKSLAPGGTTPAVVVPETTVTAPEEIAPPQTDITFTTPLRDGPPEVVGKSLSELIKGSPLFPPIEGIPESLWKGQACSNCHSWTKEALCEQGKTYSGPIGPEALQKKHPYGGAVKAALKTFALEGCR